MVFTPKGGTMNYPTDHFNQKNQSCETGSADHPASVAAVSTASRPDKQQPPVWKPTFKQFLYSLRNPSCGESTSPSTTDPKMANRRA